MVWLASVLSKLGRFSPARRARVVDRDYCCPLPDEFIIEIGNLCNLRCRYCPTGNRAPIERGMMSLAEFELIFERVKPYARTFHLYNFGEPLLNKDLLPIISLSAGAGIATHIDSNLTVHDLSDSEAEAIVASGLNRLVASIDGASQETYELYRIGGSFERATANLSRLVKARARLSVTNPDLIWKFLVHAFNEHEMEDARRRAKQIGVQIIFDLMDVPLEQYESSLHKKVKAGQKLDLQTAVGSDQARTPPAESRTPPGSDPPVTAAHEAECAPPVAAAPAATGSVTGQPPAAAPEVKQSKSTLPIPITAISLAPQLYNWCLQPFHTAVINFNGDLYPCCNVFGPEYALGNLHRQSLEQIWNNSKTVACRRFLLGYGPPQQTGSICETLPCSITHKHIDQS
ncbi:MAG: radical SAM/SPASM domain-containing protein [Thermoanaerobaculales bacterium]